MNKTQTRAYVFAITPSGHRPAAVIEVMPDGGGVFRYGQSWLSGGGYALDPVNLPLQDRVFVTKARSGVFGVCLDAGPDAWGRQVMMATHQRTPRNEVEFLLGCRGSGVGALRFSLARSDHKEPRPLPSLHELAAAAAAADAVASRGEVDPALLDLLIPGSTLGGARPKACFVDDAGDEWLVKFPRYDDPVPVPQLEDLWLSRAESLGLPVPVHRLMPVPGGRKALALRRFDRDAAGQPLHYLSAHSILNLDRVRLDDPRLSYREIAYLGRQFVTAPREYGRELYRRMAFNAIAANTDDHAKNLGYLYDSAERHWDLAPAFDLVPQLSNPGVQALAVGKDGRVASVDNLLSECGQFGISRDDAEDILRETAEAFVGIHDLMKERDIPTSVCKAIEDLVAPLRQDVLRLRKNALTPHLGPELR